MEKDETVNPIREENDNNETEPIGTDVEYDDKHNEDSFDEESNMEGNRIVRRKKIEP